MGDGVTVEEDVSVTVEPGEGDDREQRAQRGDQDGFALFSTLFLAPVIMALSPLQSRRLIKMGEAAEELETFFDFLARQREQTLGTEALDGKRAHDSAVEHGVLEDGRE